MTFCFITTRLDTKVTNGISMLESQHVPNAEVKQSNAQMHRSESRFDEDFQHKVSILIGGPASQLKGLLHRSQALKPVGDHVVKTRQDT